MVNGRGDLSMTHKSWVGKPAIFIKTTKAGLAYIQSLEDPKQYTSVPMKNVEEVIPQIELWEADPDCDHEIVDGDNYSGVKCKKCKGWFCF